MGKSGPYVFMCHVFMCICVSIYFISLMVRGNFIPPPPPQAATPNVSAVIWSKNREGEARWEGEMQVPLASTVGTTLETGRWRFRQWSQKPSSVVLNPLVQEGMGRTHRGVDWQHPLVFGNQVWWLTSKSFELGPKTPHNCCDFLTTHGREYTHTYVYICFTIRMVMHYTLCKKTYNILFIIYIYI